MKINQILKKYPSIKLATPSESLELCKFIKKSPMHSDGLDLIYDREPCFFKFLEYQGHHYEVISARGPSGELLLVASISVREGYVDGRKVNIAYFSDLRIDSAQMTSRFFHAWKKCMGEIVSHLHEIDSICADYIITAIMADNHSAKRSLVTRNANTFEYLKLSNYQMINILRKWKYTKNRTYKINFFDGDTEELIEFLASIEKTKSFGHTEKFIRNAITTWPNAGVDRFVVARENGEIKAATLVWNPGTVKKIVVNNFLSNFLLVSFFLKFMFKVPKKSKELKVEYLNFINIEKGHETSFGGIVDFIFKSGHMKDFHSLAFGDFESAPLSEYIKGSFYLKTDIELYQVVDKGRMSRFVDFKERPGFEISLV